MPATAHRNAADFGRFKEFSKMGVVVNVDFYLGLHRSKKTIGYIHPDTGLINLSPQQCYGKFQGRKDLSRELIKQAMAGDELVTAFTMEVAHRKNDGNTLVLNRLMGDRYTHDASEAPAGELWRHSFPMCEINTRIRGKHETSKGLKPLSVWTRSNMTDSTSNRADVWRIESEGNALGQVSFMRLLVLSLDDGETFQIVGETGWEGMVYKRKVPGPYTLQHPDDRAKNAKSKFKSLQAIAANPAVADILQNYVFVPDKGYENFERRLQVLLVPEFRAIIEKIGPSLPTWERDETFWVFPEPRPLKDDEALVDFYLYGLGDAAGGFAILAQPRTLSDGRTVKQVQLRHWGVTGAEVNEEGLKQVRPGDIIQVLDIIEQPPKFHFEGQGKNKEKIIDEVYDPIGIVRLIYERSDG